MSASKGGGSGYAPGPNDPPIIEVARKAWGEPNLRHSMRDDIRFGSNGSKSVKPSANTWFDHEAGSGGGYRDLYKMAFGCWPSGPKPNGHSPLAGQLPPWRNVGVVYLYRRADGATAWEVVRAKAGPKSFAQRRPLGDDRYRWGVKEIPDFGKLPYRLPELLASAAVDAVVFVPEGEKDVERLRGLGLVATCNAGGAGKWLPDLNQYLAGRRVVLLPDNDEAGRKHANLVGRNLTGVAASVQVLTLPGLPHKGDVSDWLSADPVGDAAEQLLDMGRQAPEWTPPVEEPPEPSGRILTGAEFVGRHVPPVWLIDGIVQRGRLYSCTSLTGHGKTAVWLFNACMIQAGRMIGQLDVFQGNVLFLAGENPADLEARMLGMMKAYGLPASKLPYVLPGAFPLDEEGADRLKADIEALGVPLTLIVGDTASSFFPGDEENDNVQAGGYARRLRTFSDCPGNPAVVVLCHPVKNAARTNLSPRGGGAFLNEQDGNLTLWSEAKGEVTELHWQAKIRGPDFSPMGYRLRSVATGLNDERDRPEMTIVAETMSEEAVANHAKQALYNEDVVLRLIRDHPEWSIAQRARDAGWVEEDGEPQKWKVQRALAALAADRLIERTRSGGPWTLTNKGNAALDNGDE